MDKKEKFSEIRIAHIRITPYLAEYARNLYNAGRSDGAIKIPYTSDLYHLVYELMDRRRADHVDVADTNLSIILPSRRECYGDCVLKNPRYYNHLSIRSSRYIEDWLRRCFNFEFHELMMRNEERGRPQRQLDVVSWFMKSHGIKSISEDALLMNFKRFRRRIQPNFVRKYEKSRKFTKN